MRTALYLVLVLTTAAVVTSDMISAEEEGLRHERFDVSILVQAHQHLRGARIGAGAPSEHDDMKAAKPPEPVQFIEVEALADLVRRNVDPGSWQEVDGAELSARGHWLVVRNRPAVVKQVAEFLYQFSLEAQRRLLLSATVVQGTSGGFPAPSDGASIASSGSLVLPLGVERMLKRTSRLHFVADYEVEIAQGSNISNPIKMSADEGLLASFVATPSLDGERVIVEALVQTAAYGTPRRLTLGVDEEYIPGPYRTDDRTSNGTLELPRYDHVQAHFTAVVPASGGMLSLPVAVRGRMVELRLDARMRGSRGNTRLIDLGGLVQAPMPVSFGRVLERDASDSWFAPRVHYLRRDRPGPGYGTAEDILDELLSRVAPAFWEEKGEVALLGERRLHVRADDRRFADANTFLRDLERQVVRPVVVDIRVWSKLKAVPAGPIKEFPRDGGLLVAAGSLPTILGRTASLMAGSTANYVVDYDVEVAQEARIADPIIGQSFDGLVVNLRPTLSPDKRTVNLNLQMLLARRMLSDQPFNSGAKFLGPIDHLRQDRSVVDTDLQIPDGSTYVVDMGIDPENKDRRLVAEIRVDLR